MKQTLRVGLVGFGMIGKAHACCYATLPYYAPNLRDYGQSRQRCSVDSETSRRAQETIGCDWSTDNYLELINSPEIGVVHICTPNALHLDALLAAIGANKHVYCEKPIVPTAQNSRSAPALAKCGPDGDRLYRGVTATAFHMRGFTAIRRAKSLSAPDDWDGLFNIGSDITTSVLSPTTPFRWKHDLKGARSSTSPRTCSTSLTISSGCPPNSLRNRRPSLRRVPSRAATWETFAGVETARRPCRRLRYLNHRKGLAPKQALNRFPIPTDRIFEHPNNTAFETDPNRMPLAVSDPTTGRRLPASLKGRNCSPAQDSSG